MLYLAFFGYSFFVGMEEQRDPLPEWVSLGVNVSCQTASWLEQQHQGGQALIIFSSFILFCVLFWLSIFFWGRYLKRSPGSVKHYPLQGAVNRAINVFHKIYVRQRILYYTAMLKMDAVDQVHRTPLHYAAKQGSVDMVRYLIRYGASVNASDKEKQSPLQLAKAAKKDDVIKLLKDSGARDEPSATARLHMLSSAV